MNFRTDVNAKRRARLSLRYCSQPYEFMLVHRQGLWAEIENAVNSIDANAYVKYSRDKVRTGKPLYDQKRINKEFEHILFPQGWQSVTTPYYVTSDIPTEREIVGIRDRAEQKRIIEAKGFERTAQTIKLIL